MPMHDDLLTEGLSISLSFSAPSARFADEVFDIACEVTRDAVPRPVALRRWWIWSPPATAHSLEAHAARAVAPSLFPEPSVRQGARAPALTGPAPRAQPLFRNMRQESFVVPCSSIPVSSPRPGTGGHRPSTPIRLMPGWADQAQPRRGAIDQQRSPSNATAGPTERQDWRSRRQP